MVFEDFQLAKYQFRKLSWSFGLDVFDENYKPGIATAITCSLAFMANAFPIYSIYIKYPDFATILKTTCLWGIVLQICPRLVKLILASKTYRYTMNIIENTYKVNDCSRTDKVLKSSLDTVKLVSKIFAFLYISAGLLFLLAPFATYYLRNEITLIFEIYIPGVDYETKRGFITTNFLHVLFVICGIFGTYGFDLVFFSYYYHIVTESEIFMVQMKVTSEYLQSNNLESPENVKIVRKKMNDIYRQHQFLLKYIGICNELFRGSCTIVTTVTSLTITLCLYLLVGESWIGGYTLVGPLVVQSFINSLIGTIATIQCEKLDEKIWNFPFYLLPALCQKEFKFFMQNAMIPRNMELFFIGTLNLTTFVNVMKTVYTYFMVLLETMKQ